MLSNAFPNIDAKNLQTPCFIIDEETLLKNAKILDYIQQNAGCKILLALKGFAVFSTFPLIKNYLAGVCAGSLYEAKLGREEFGKEVQTYSPAFKEEEFEEILTYSDKIIFNSASQLEKFGKTALNAGKQIGLRVNPEKSVAGKLFGVYDPCCENSRLGSRVMELEGYELEVTGLHFHALCEQGLDELKEVLTEFEKKFDNYLRKVSWVNFGGGHHITKQGYDIEGLIGLIKDFRKKYPNIKEVYLEPGEAVVLNAGILLTSILDIIKNKKKIVILDTSVETHFPDVLITRYESQPYMQEIFGAAKPDIFKYNYVLAGVSCAAGDVFGEYSFDNELKVGEKLVFTDVAHYTMVKTSTFCGVPLPSIFLRRKNGSLEKIKEFGYNDYKTRLG